MELQRQVDEPTIRMGGFNTLLSEMEGSSKWQISKNIVEYYILP